MTYWLADPQVVAELQEAARSKMATPSALGKSRETPTRRGVRHHARLRRNTGQVVAEIRVEGVLTKRPDAFAAMLPYGNTTYEALQEELRAAERDPSVRELRLVIDSPGGEADGLFDTLAVLQAVTKPIRVVASKALSAAYVLAAAAGPIEATSAGAMFGSIGASASFLVNESLATFTNTDSPDKRPDLTTEEGRDIVRRHLDGLHALMVDAIATGRRTTAAHVGNQFGRGATFLAREAKRRGMIDSIAMASTKTFNASPARPAARRTSMDIERLRKDEPALFAALVEEGIAKERERACAHLTMGEQCGDLGIALAAIRDGEALTQDTQAKYMAAAMKRGGYHAQLAASTLGGVDDAHGKQVCEAVDRLLSVGGSLAEVEG